MVWLQCGFTSVKFSRHLVQCRVLLGPRECVLKRWLGVRLDVILQRGPCGGSLGSGRVSLIFPFELDQPYANAAGCPSEHLRVAGGCEARTKFTVQHLVPLRALGFSFRTGRVSELAVPGALGGRKRVTLMASWVPEAEVVACMA